MTSSTADRARAEWTSRVAHDLTQPLYVINSSARSLTRVSAPCRLPLQGTP